MIHRRAALAAFLLSLASCGVTSMMTRTHTIEGVEYGQVDGRDVLIFTLTNSNDLACKITNWGATVTELWVPDRDGVPGDVALGFDTLAEYQEKSPYFGCIAGRVANRIAFGRFSLEGREYQLATNNGPHHLHGGERGLDKRVWDAEPLTRDDGPALRLTYRSPNGEEGYPGELDVEVVYVWTDDNELRVEMKATCDRTTPVNLVHHTYWNLAGHGSGTILDHMLELDAAHYTPGDETLIPTGAIDCVENTAFDFREPKPIGRDLPGGTMPGYDVNYVVDGVPNELRRVARVVDPQSGRVMEVFGDQPGVQFYTGTFLPADLVGKGGATYGPYGGFCLETQLFPDVVNQSEKPGWPSPWLRLGETYEHVMVHRFDVE